MAPLVTGRQVRAARALLGWSQYKLADEAGISVTPIARFERGVVDTKIGTLKVLMQTLEKAGIDFLSKKDGRMGVMVKPSEDHSSKE